MVDQTQPEILEVHTANKAKKHAADRLKRLEATMDMVIGWLDANIDDGGFENDEAKDMLASDSADLKQKINISLDPSTSVKDIIDGNL